MSSESQEIARLIELMPASGRMYCKLISQPQQATVVDARVPLPWESTRPIRINFALLNQLPIAQRDLLILHVVCWLTSIQWFKPELYQGLVALGLAGTAFELVQLNAAGTITFAGLTALAAAQIWRKGRSSEIERIADEKAVQVAQRRGYGETEAAEHLLAAIEAVAQLEGRPLTLNEQVRQQNLRGLIGLPPLDLQV